jgi:hypothetical protein
LSEKVAGLSEIFHDLTVEQWIYFPAQQKRPPSFMVAAGAWIEATTDIVSES